LLVSHSCINQNQRLPSSINKQRAAIIKLLHQQVRFVPNSFLAPHQTYGASTRLKFPVSMGYNFIFIF
jgi:hypothetical protein